MLEFDHDRLRRVGMPEAVLCLDKSDDQLAAIVAELAESATSPVLFTRLDTERHARLPGHLRDRLDHDPVSATAVLGGSLPARPGTVGIVAAGTSDTPVSAEARRTLEFSGIATRSFVDVGVAGLWRLEHRLDEIRSTDVVIVVAGMDGALVSVLGGLVAAPVIAVPTSTGYGAARDGETAMFAALASCAQGVTVVNVDNGFGAACAAARILSIVARSDPAEGG